MLNSMGYGAIALADVDYLVVHDNIIENNGPSHLRAYLRGFSFCTRRSGNLAQSNSE